MLSDKSEGDFTAEDELLVSQLATIASLGLQHIEARTAAKQRERELEAHQREFYQRTIMAATEGKLVIAEEQDIDGIACDPVASWRVDDHGSYARLRDEVRRFASESGMERSRAYSFLGCVVEAVANAMTHAGGDDARLCHGDDALTFVISDSGPGIGALSLPDVALTKHYSTVGTLGMGYKIMIEFADRVYLSTGPEGTTVAIEMRLQPSPELSA